MILPMAEEPNNPESNLRDSADPFEALTRTLPALEENGIPGQDYSDRTDPHISWVRTVPVVEKYWHLVFTGLLQEEQLNGAVRAADSAGADVEDVLIQSYRVAPA